jgi:putative oxidoreductase
MKRFITWLTHPPADGARSILFLRLMAGGVFFWEGLLKFVYTNQGVGRFTKLGFPYPHFTATFVACFEIAAACCFSPDSLLVSPHCRSSSR